MTQGMVGPIIDPQFGEHKRVSGFSRSDISNHNISVVQFNSVVSDQVKRAIKPKGLNQPLPWQNE